MTLHGQQFNSDLGDNLSGCMHICHAYMCMPLSSNLLLCTSYFLLSIDWLSDWNAYLIIYLFTFLFIKMWREFNSILKIIQALTFCNVFDFQNDICQTILFWFFQQCVVKYLQSCKYKSLPLFNYTWTENADCVIALPLR